MRTITTFAELTQQIAAARSRGERIGAIFAASLTPSVLQHVARRARAQCEFVVLLPVSHYVGPAPRHAASELPRFTLRERPLPAPLVETLPVDIAWAPTAEELRLPGSTSVVCVPPDRAPSAIPFDRASAEATLLLKLVGAAHPDVVYVDAQDAVRTAMLRRVHADLFCTVPLQVVPEVRDDRGILVPPQRGGHVAPELAALPAALDRATEAAAAGETSIGRLRARIEVALAAQPALRPRYVEIVDAQTLASLDRLDSPALVLVAVDVAAAHALDHRILQPVTAHAHHAAPPSRMGAV